VIGEAMGASRSCVIIVENLPVPLDRRVWQEAQALILAGWRVSVICPRTAAYPAPYEVLESIAVYRHPLPLEARRKCAFLAEYAVALWQEFRLLWKVRREQGFAVIQACNPPDVICLAAAPFKLLGVRFVFDQHDLSPELYAAKFGRRGLAYRVLRLFERMTYRLADTVITANQSFRDIAISRGGKKPENVQAVYSVPSRTRIFRGAPDPRLREGVRIVIGYLGVIGDQDGVDHLVRAVRAIVDNGISDFRAVIVGDGPALCSVRALARALGVDNFIVFAGYRSGEDLIAHISAFDIGVIPDPVNEVNDLMSMNKVFEYCALGIPTVTYRLKETARLLGDVGVYAPTDTPEGLAAACLGLLRDDQRREACAQRALRLSAEKFNWEREAAKYVAAFESVVAHPLGAPTPVSSVETIKESTAPSH